MDKKETVIILTFCYNPPDKKEKVTTKVDLFYFLPSVGRTAVDIELTRTEVYPEHEELTVRQVKQLNLS